MPISVQQVVGTVVYPARQLVSGSKNTTGVSLIIDFGRPGYPDHWYASAWDLESVKEADQFYPGSKICVSGDVRKYLRNGKTEYTLNISAFYEVSDFDDD
jgi:hypothetical protein